eukprot:TRINITY_DN1769_c0_g1_i5.p1 TRINITY_DN1769_c0_g1~~TRINITY_DN1769_c0_g1_i5.p1  ORF type:complete len:211 (-),score=47.79 TRINITY_DN1769_c0_g1_i5:76-708(-)
MLDAVRSVPEVLEREPEVTGCLMMRYHCGDCRADTSPVPRLVSRAGLLMLGFSWGIGWTGIAAVIFLVIAGANLHSALTTTAYVVVGVTQVPCVTGVLFGWTKNFYVGVVHLVFVGVMTFVLVAGLCVGMVIIDKATIQEVCIEHSLFKNCDLSKAYFDLICSALLVFCLFVGTVAFLMTLWFLHVVRTWRRLKFTKLKTETELQPTSHT